MSGTQVDSTLAADNAVLLETSSDCPQEAGKVIPIMAAKPKGTPSIKRHKRESKPKGASGAQSPDKWTSTPANQDEGQPEVNTSKPASVKKARRQPTKPRTVEELQKQLDRLQQGQYSDVFWAFVAWLESQDRVAAHAVRKPIAESLSYFTNQKGFSKDNALGLIGRKLDIAEKLLNENAPSIREQKEAAKQQFHNEKIAVEELREQMLAEFKSSDQGKKYLIWLEANRKALYIGVTTPASSNLKFYQDVRGNSPAEALRIYQRILNQNETAYQVFLAWVNKLEERWNRVREEFWWVRNSLDSQTKKAFIKEFEDAAANWPYPILELTLNKVEEVAARKSEHFLSSGGKGSSKKRGKTPGQLKRSDQEANKRRNLPHRSKDNPSSGGR
jgi:hypothetical protein